MVEPLLELRALDLGFGNIKVARSVSLRLHPGEIHALIGPNGAGKSSLVHLISGTLQPDAGAVFFSGRNVTTWSPARRARAGLARCFQISSVLPGFSALENVALAVQARSGSSFRFIRPARSEHTLNDAALAALDQLGLAHRATARADALSHGKKRQLELAIAIAREPLVLLLDEPLAGAGAEETARLIALLDRLRQRYAILLVEHDMAAVFALADRISVLVEGRIIATGGAAQIRADAGVREAYLGEDALA